MLPFGRSQANQANIMHKDLEELPLLKEWKLRADSLRAEITGWGMLEVLFEQLKTALEDPDVQENIVKQDRIERERPPPVDDPPHWPQWMVTARKIANKYQQMLEQVQEVDHLLELVEDERSPGGKEYARVKAHAHMNWHVNQLLTELVNMYFWLRDTKQIFDNAKIVNEVNWVQLLITIDLSVDEEQFEAIRLLERAINGFNDHGILFPYAWTSRLVNRWADYVRQMGNEIAKGQYHNRYNQIYDLLAQDTGGVLNMTKKERQELQPELLDDLPPFILTLTEIRRQFEPMREYTQVLNKRIKVIRRPDTWLSFGFQNHARSENIQLYVTNLGIVATQLNRAKEISDILWVKLIEPLQGNPADEQVTAQVLAATTQVRDEYDQRGIPFPYHWFPEGMPWFPQPPDEEDEEIEIEEDAQDADEEEDEEESELEESELEEDVQDLDEDEEVHIEIDQEN